VRRPLAALVAATLVACGPSPEVEQVCRRAPELESSLVAVDASLESLEAMRPRLLQSSLAVLKGTLDVMSEVAPASVGTDLGVVRASYAGLDDAFAAVFYDGRVAFADAEIARAIEEIRGNRTLEALERVRRFLADRCVGGVGYAPPLAAVPGSTLPGPPLVVDPDVDPETGFEDEASAARSFGRLVGELRGLVLDDGQAECVGNALLEAGALGSGAIDAFDELAASVLARCTRPPETTSTTAD